MKLFPSVRNKSVLLTAALSLLWVTSVSMAGFTQVNAGGSVAGAFAADQCFSGGSAYTSADAVVTTGVVNPAPVAVYQSERYGNFTYTADGLVAGSTCQVRLHLRRDLLECGRSAQLQCVDQRFAGDFSATGLFTAGMVVGGPFTVTVTSSSVNRTASVTVIAKPRFLIVVSLGFEEVCSGMFAFWSSTMWQPTTTFSVESNPSIVRSGAHSAKIVSSQPNDAMWVSNESQYVDIIPGKTYRIHGYIRTDNVTGNPGAHINAKTFPSGDFCNASQTVTGTVGWTETVLEFNSGTDTQMQIWCRLGHWGGWGDLSQGTAWFDGIWIEQLP